MGDYENYAKAKMKIKEYLGGVVFGLSRARWHTLWNNKAEGFAGRVS